MRMKCEVMVMAMVMQMLLLKRVCECGVMTGMALWWHGDIEGFKCGIGWQDGAEDWKI